MSVCIRLECGCARSQPSAIMTPRGARPKAPAARAGRQGSRSRTARGRHAGRFSPTHRRPQPLSTLGRSAAKKGRRIAVVWPPPPHWLPAAVAGDGRECGTRTGTPAPGCLPPPPTHPHPSARPPGAAGGRTIASGCIVEVGALQMDRVGGRRQGDLGRVGGRRQGAVRFAPARALAKSP